MIRFFVLFLSIVFLSIEGFCEEPLKTVRVGYFHRDAFQEGSEGTSLRGYAYEYYQRVAQYTGWRYEYIFGTREEIYQKFLKGDVDLMAGLTFSKEREGLMNCPNIPMGRQLYHFLKKGEDKSLSANPASWRGKRFGVIRGDMFNSLRLFLDESKIDAKVEIYDSSTEQNLAFESNSVDAILIENLEMVERPEVESFFRMSNSSYYLCVSTKRPDLYGMLKRALGQLMEDDPIVTAKLYNKYLKASSASKNLTGPEKAWIASHDTLRVGYLRNLLPYSDDRLGSEGFEIDSVGNIASNGDLPSGIINDVIPEMTRHLTFKKIFVQYKGYDTYDEMISDVTRGRQDVVFPVGGNLYWAEKNGFYETAPVIRSELDLVFKEKFSESVLSTFAVNSKSKMMEYYVREYFPKASVKYYSSIEECLDAVKNGEVTATVLGNLRSEHILKNRRYSKLSVKLLDIPNEKYFGVAIGNESLLKLLNRGIALMEDDFALNSSYKYTDRLYKDDVLSIMIEHSVYTFSFLTIIFVLVVLFLVNRFRRIKKQAARELAQNERLNMQLDVIKSISDLYHSVFLVNVPENSFEIIHTFEAIEKAVGKYRSQVQTALDLMTEHMIQERHKSAMRKFNKVSDWPKVLANQDSAYEEYEGLVQGWCGVTIIVARRDDRGVPTHVLYISQEINRQKKAEQNLQDALAQAEQANNAKTFFLNNMSHDIRTPMNAIIGFTSLAATHIDDKDRLMDYLNKISTSSEHLLSLINDVLDMRRIESGKVKLEENDVHLPDILNDIKTIVQANVLRKRQNLFVEAVDLTHENIVVDKLRLNQVLLNLLSNSIKFTKDGGTISLRIIEKPCETAGRARYELRVKDNGIGISPEFQSRIFDAFSREETSTVSGIQGTGLGMAITKNIVNMMGGDIEIVSDEGKGTEFVVSLEFKLSDKLLGPEIKDEPKKKAFDFKGYRILLAEDNLLNQEIAVTLLTEAGFVVDVAGNGMDALHKMQSASADAYQLILMDIQMPVMDGYEATSAIRKLDDSAKANIPIVAMTANAFDEDRQKTVAVGMNGYLPKPIDIQMLMETLEKILA